MPFIVIDQFGYLPHAKKTAVIRNPITGFDNDQSFSPGNVYQVVDALTNQPVFEGSPVQFNNGATDAASGDQIWWFDFSPVSTPGNYYILDVENKQKSYYGMIFYVSAEHSLFPANNQSYMEAAEDYLHYIHGVNPFGFVYLTNMDSCGASKSLTEIFHTWFSEGNPKWGTVGVSTYGPAPSCCPNRCGGSQNDKCPPVMHLKEEQPPAKSYADTNTGWPVEIWQITEPSCGYQVAYIRLLSKFVNRNQSNAIKKVNVSQEPAPVIFPNSSKEIVNIQFMQEPLKGWEIFEAQMRLLAKQQVSGHSAQVGVSALSKGIYFLRITTNRKSYVQQVIVQ
jgi:hypothetical protein